jgi:small subunit ribosomal protein S1
MMMVEEQKEEGAEDFAAMLEKSMVKRERLEPGQVVEAKIVKISDEWVFLDLGGKGEGYLDKKEVLDAEGKPTVREGDTMRAYFLSSKNNDLVFTTKIGSGPAIQNQLEDAWKAGVPVEGTVSKEVKGGFEVKIGTARAFCPFSQMGMRREEKGDAYVGKSLSFKILEFNESGRNILVTRRPILDEERRLQKEELKKTLQEGMRVKGTVTSLQKFGAFVNIGGIEGLLPISEVAWSRTEKISDVLSAGQQIEVVIKKIDWENERFSFSLKDILADPWDSAAEKFPVGSFHPGKVSRLAPFGAFVTMAEGIDGLIHISKLGAGKRIAHPKEVVREGQEIEVRVEAVDRQNHKLSLSLAEVSREEEEAAATLKDYKQREAAETKSLGSLGELLKAQMEKKKN